MSEDRVYLLDLDDCGVWNEEGRFVSLREALMADVTNHEPTIALDIMLMWLHDSENDLYNHSTNDRMKEAIRAILEQHRLRTATDKTQVTVWGYTLDELGEIVRQHKECPHLIAKLELELKTAIPFYIRAFVERVENKWGTSRYPGMKIELEAMEKEGGTNEPISD